MNKTILYILVSLTTISLIGCTNKTTSSTTTPSSNTSSTTSIQVTNEQSIESPVFTLTEKSSYFCPFVFNGTDLIFSNPDENNRISTIKDPLPKNILKSSDVIDFADYSADNIALIDKTIYFSNGSDNNALSSFDIPDKTYTKLNTHSVNNLISINTELFYINKDDENRIYKYDTITSKSMLISADSVGSFIVNGDFIIYQNLSDNSKLYSIKTDGTSRQKLTDYTANSFVVFDEKLLFFNSSDNNNLYSIDPSTLSCKRIYIMNGSQLKTIDKYLYFINESDSNNLYSLSVDLVNSTATYKPEIYEGVNTYYLTSAGIFYTPSSNVNNIYYKKFSTQS
jgi:hypothetical protein